MEIQFKDRIDKAVKVQLMKLIQTTYLGTK